MMMMNEDDRVDMVGRSCCGIALRLSFYISFRLDNHDDDNHDNDNGKAMFMGTMNLCL